MIVLGSFQVSVFFLLAVFETLGTILLCYSIAVTEGHVPAWLPMISDCAVLAPEKYPFRLGLISGALLMEVEILLAYFSNKGYSNNNLSLIAGSIAAVGLGVVGAINEQENNTIHSGQYYYDIIVVIIIIIVVIIVIIIIIIGCAVLFFFGYLLYMITMTLNADTSIALLSISIKKICTIITGVALVAFVYMSMLLFL